MNAWSGGYVTDVDYIAGYYPEQSPFVLALACLISGFATDVMERRDTLHYMELGCGRGRNALVAAAANPGWRVTAVDFNPAAIAEARVTAAAAGLDNITFLEADLAALAGSEAAAAIPEVDVVSMHGVWSWVPEPVRQGIIRLLRDKVRAGGLVQVSYNVLPGLQGALGMQRLLRLSGTALASRSDRQAMAGQGVVRELLAAGAVHLADQKTVGALLQAMEKAPVAYLAHEYMNDTWYPCFHSDVADAMAGAKLDYAAAPRLPENFPELMMNEPQRAIYDRFDDGRLRELVKDMCSSRGLRHDVYVRGARRLSPEARDQALRELTLTLAVAPERFIFKLDMPAGEATLAEAFYRPVTEALAERPHSVEELLSLPALAGRSDNPVETVAMLVGTLQAALVARPDAVADVRLRRFNAVLARQNVQRERLNAPLVAASTRLGGGLPCRGVELFLLERIGATGGGVDPGIWAAELGHDLPPDEVTRLREVLINVLRERLPIWRNAGLV
ncbi:MAG TPA: class I SAM-dependent methyltransferase [Acetobacteraceae bacterium]